MRNSIIYFFFIKIIIIYIFLYIFIFFILLILNYLLHFQFYLHSYFSKPIRFIFIVEKKENMFLFNLFFSKEENKIKEEEIEENKIIKEEKIEENKIVKNIKEEKFGKYKL